MSEIENHPLTQESLVHAYAVLPVQQRCSELIQWGHDILAGQAHFQTDPMSDIFAMQAVMRGIIAEANGPTISLHQTEPWVEPQVDPVGAIYQAQQMAGQVLGAFEALIAKPASTIH